VAENASGEPRQVRRGLQKTGNKTPSPGSFDWHRGGASFVSGAATGTIKVLVIDDSNTIRRSAELFLRQAGYDVILAEDGFDALAKISDYQPQVIFVDIMMPRLDGYQTCALIKQNPQLKSTPVIMLSSKDGVFDRARGRLAGSDRYLTKPFTKEGLLEAISQHVRPAPVSS